MDEVQQLAYLDQRFVDIYEATRDRAVDRQKQRALIVIQDDDLMLFRHGRALERFPGLMPPLYDKMKTIGHAPLAVFCLLEEHTDQALPDIVQAEVEAYRTALEGAAEAFDTRVEASEGIVPAPLEIYPRMIAFLDSVIPAGRVSKEALSDFAGSVTADIQHALTAAAHAQLIACEKIVNHIRDQLLTESQWAQLRVLVLGPYMARQGQLFLQYFSKLLDTPPQGDERLVYFEGKDLGEAFERLGTTMLDTVASHAIFGDPKRLHRDVLADAAAKFVKKLRPR